MPLFLLHKVPKLGLLVKVLYILNLNTPCQIIFPQVVEMNTSASCVSCSLINTGCYYSFLIYLFFILWLCWVFVSVRGPSPVVASGGHSSSRCAGLSLSRPLLWRSTGSRRAGSVIVAHGPSRSVACGILPDQGPNPCPPHRQADSQPLHHQGSPYYSFLIFAHLIDENGILFYFDFLPISCFICSLAICISPLMNCPYPLPSYLGCLFHISEINFYLSNVE